MSTRPATMLRWFLVPIAAAGAWYIALATGLLLRGAVHRLAFPFCLDKRVISENQVCMDPWFNPLLDVAVYVGAGFAAFLILVSCVGVAPTHKRLVARVIYVVGAAVAIFGGIAIGGADGYLSMVSAIGVGALTTMWLNRRHAPANVA